MEFPPDLDFSLFSKMERLMPDKPTLFAAFSGGKTSGYMCHWLIENKSEEYELIFVFANTGLEHPKTLEFVDKCDKYFGLKLTWVEAKVNPQHGKGVRHSVVDFTTASRNGEPFKAFAAKYGIPNVAYNQCSERLKTFPMESYRRSLGYRAKHLTAIGIRADEPRRISSRAEKQGLVYPLAHWTHATLDTVTEFWENQPFNLDIPSYMGNCVTCWKKSDRKLFTIAVDEPEWFVPFNEMEEKYCNVGEKQKPRYFFRKHRTTKMLIEEAQSTNFTPYVDENFPRQLDLLTPDDRVRHLLSLSDLDEQDFDCGESCEPF